MDEARELIDEFQEKLSFLLEEDKKQEVYQLTVSLFPLQVSQERGQDDDKC